MKIGKSPIWDAEDCALVLIDYQPEMFSRVKSEDPKLIELNVCTLARAAKEFNMPIVLSTVGVKMGVNRPTIEGLRKTIPGVTEIDRSSMDAWEDAEFLKAVKATGRKRLVFGALYTEICLAYPVVHCLADDYEANFVVDAVGGQSKVEHDMAILRMIQAGAVPNTTLPMICEWFRDWTSPIAQKGREIFGPYMQEREKVLNAESQSLSH
jgi:nicotinamidase-related amidase